jgi:hypothetical protein
VAAITGRRSKPTVAAITGRRNSPHSPSKTLQFFRKYACPARIKLLEA